MLYINPKTNNIVRAKEEHLEAVKCIIWKKIGAKTSSKKFKKCSNSNCNICNSKIKIVPNIPAKLYELLNDDDFIEMLICENPTGLLTLDKMVWGHILPGIEYDDRLRDLGKKDKSLGDDNLLFKNFIVNYINIIKKIIAYDSWFIAESKEEHYSAYQLAKNLDRRSCTYCNRTFTNTMRSSKGGKLMRPQFDHWYPQSKFPLLGLSFFNLIPSCSICNSSSKGNTVLNPDTHIHPYTDINQTDEFKFQYEYSQKLNTYKIFIESSKKTNEHPRKQNKSKLTLEKLEIDTMYNAHHDELSDLIRIKKAYSETYIEKMRSLFPNAGLSMNEVYRLLFGTELEVKDFHRRPMSKFKYDILKELGIID